MADHNREEREALIEKLRSIRREASLNADEVLTIDQAIEIIFEQAHTPTSDERDEPLEEALAYLDTLNADRQIRYDDYRNLHDLVSSATRRPEVPHEHVWQNRVSGGSKCVECDLWQDKRVTEPQGEPSDAQDTEEPEWEYECRIPPFGWKTCTDDPRFCPKGSERRRRKAGPWEAVPAADNNERGDEKP